MTRAKGIVIAIIVVLVIGVLAVGGSYLVAKSKHNKAAEELSRGKDLLENGKEKAAISVFKDYIAEYSDMPGAPEAMFLLAKTLRKQNPESREAKAMFDKILKQYPDSAFARQARYYKAMSLVKDTPFDEQTRSFFRNLAEEDAENPQAAYVAQYGLALADLQAGRLDKAKTRLDDLLESAIPDELRNRVENTLGDLNLRLLYSPEITGDDEYYTIKRGDYIYELARKFDVTQELLMECNRISDPRRIREGQRIKIPNVDFSILVDRYDNTLTLLANGKFFKEYPVRTGKYEGQTPTGEFEIIHKKKDPEWTDPITNKKYPSGHPENELGTRWMAFRGSMLGIHGTIKPETVGLYSSQGCVGMYKEDVEELYKLVPTGTPIRITGEMNPQIVQKSKAMGYRD